MVSSSAQLQVTVHRRVDAPQESRGNSTERHMKPCAPYRSLDKRSANSHMQICGISRVPRRDGALCHIEECGFWKASPELELPQSPAEFEAEGRVSCSQRISRRT